jgi:hypothetical protein
MRVLLTKPCFASDSLAASSSRWCLSASSSALSWEGFAGEWLGPDDANHFREIPADDWLNAPERRL